MTMCCKHSSVNKGTVARFLKEKQTNIDKSSQFLVQMYQEAFSVMADPLTCLCYSMDWVIWCLMYLQWVLIWKKGGKLADKTFESILFKGCVIDCSGLPNGSVIDVRVIQITFHVWHKNLPVALCFQVLRHL